nr:MAG TPA: helix-turn-helix domain protein [Caudoviricetes sp.]
MECQRVNNKEAAKLLGMSVARMQALMDRKLIDIGVVIQPMPGYKKRSYQVYRSKLNKWLGLEDEKSRLPTKTTCKG